MLVRMGFNGFQGSYWRFLGVYGDATGMLSRVCMGFTEFSEAFQRVQRIFNGVLDVTLIFRELSEVLKGVSETF